MDEKNIDAMVARGAALANLEQFDRAIRQLEHALRIDPHHENAKKYLLTIEQKLEKMRAELAERNSPAPKLKSKGSTSEAVLQALLSQDVQNKKEKKQKRRSSSSKTKHSHRDSEKRKRSRYHSRSPHRKRSKH